MADVLDLRGVKEPELVFGLVGALGSPMNKVVELLSSKLQEVSYHAREIHLSRFLEAYTLSTPVPKADDTEFDKRNALMSRGNELRKLFGRGDALAMHAAAEIHDQRDHAGSGALERQAFILRQLKHHDEVKLLRQIYEDGFHLISVYTPDKYRSEYLRNIVGLTTDDAKRLLDRDAGEEFSFGQQVTKTFHLADLFIGIHGSDDQSIEIAKGQIDRYIDLLFGIQILTPTIDEYGMFLAYSAGLRSSDLSRQVGAAIITDTGEVVSLGANEVPKAGGGQYWGCDYDDRDFKRGYDSNEKIKLECVEEVLACIENDAWEEYISEEKNKRVALFAAQLAKTRLMNLTEFGRSVHGEMEAILSANRQGKSVRGQNLYVTTFPCHNCAKHIVGSGVKRVVYVEPYSKSLADRLHGDAIAFTLDIECKDKVGFQPFQGVSWRRFAELFSTTERDGSRIRRKLSGGNLDRTPVGLRVAVSPLSHVEREAIVAEFLRSIKEHHMSA